MESSKIHVIDDERVVRESLHFLFSNENYKVETYESAFDFLDKVEPTSTGCIVMDVRMPEMSGLELLDELKKRRLAMPAIVITGYGEVSLAIQAMKAGAVDFLEKFEGEALLTCVHRVLSGADEQETQSFLLRLATLTRREGEVLAGVVNGKLNKTIAFELGISTRTVETHRAQVMRKMKAGSLAELVRVALRVPEAIASLEARRGDFPFDARYKRSGAHREGVSSCARGAIDYSDGSEPSKPLGAA